MGSKALSRRITLHHCNCCWQWWAEKWSNATISAGWKSITQLRFSGKMCTTNRGHHHIQRILLVFLHFMCGSFDFLPDLARVSQRLVIKISINDEFLQKKSIWFQLDYLVVDVLAAEHQCLVLNNTGSFHQWIAYFGLWFCTVYILRLVTQFF